MTVKSVSWLALVGGLLFAVTAPAETVEGVWRGSIATPGAPLRVVVSLEQDEGGEWTGGIDIPSQGLRDYALADVSVEGDQVAFAMEGIPGRPSFAGTYDGQAQSLSGTFTQGPQRLTFALERADSSAGAGEPLGEGIPGEGVTGEWLGTLEAGPVELRIALTLRKTEDGGLSGSMDSLDQGAMDIPIEAIAHEDQSLRFEVPSVGGWYEGELSEDGSAIAGAWAQMGNSNPLVFYRMAEPVALSRPQEPKPPFPYEIREVGFDNPAASIRLSGTYLVPHGAGPFPAVVFVSGSGPQDRDEALMGHRPFAVIADALARRGIASLRYDDRGFGRSEGDHWGSSVQEFAEDARSAARFLASQKEVDQEAVGIVGHSEGGLVGPMAAAGGEDLVDFLVLLAPPAEPLDRLLARQSLAIGQLAGVDEELLQRSLAPQERELALIKDESLDRAELKAALWEIWHEQKAELTEEEMRQLQLSDERVRQAADLVSSDWFRSLMRIDPRPYLRSLQVPTLAVFGEKDVQVDASVNARNLEEALQEHGHSNHQVVVRPGLNHLFQRSATGSMQEYGQIEETFDPETLELIGDWILQQAR